MDRQKDMLDLLIKNCQVVTMDEDNTVLENALVGIKDGKIAVLEEINSEVTYQAREEIDALGKVVFPGLINSHSHFFQALLKGLGADLSLIDWVAAVVVPYGQKITPELDHYAAKLVALEALQSGCTTITDFMYAHHLPGMGDAVIEALQEMQIRGIFIRNFHDCGKDYNLPDPYIEPLDKVFNEVLRLRDTYAKNSGDMIRVWTGPGVTWGISSDGLRETAEFCKSENIPYSMHLLETEDDNVSALKRYNKKAVELLAETGFLSPLFLAVHCVKLSAEDIKMLAEHDVRVSYNAVSNMYLGSGVPPIVELMKEGVTLSVGTDGAASNNAQDMIETLKISSLLQKVRHEDPGIFSAEDVLKMATIDGAKCLHWADKIGSIETGKQADMFIFNPSSPKSTPMYDPVATLVYSSSRDNVETTIVNGRIVYDKGEFKNGIDVERFRAELMEKLTDLIN